MDKCIEIYGIGCRWTKAEYDGKPIGKVDIEVNLPSVDVNSGLPCLERMCVRTIFKEERYNVNGIIIRLDKFCNLSITTENKGYIKTLVYKYLHTQPHLGILNKTKTHVMWRIYD